MQYYSDLKETEETYYSHWPKPHGSLCISFCVSCAYNMINIIYTYRLIHIDMVRGSARVQPSLSKTKDQHVIMNSHHTMCHCLWPITIQRIQHGVTFDFVSIHKNEAEPTSQVGLSLDPIKQCCALVSVGVNVGTCPVVMQLKQFWRHTDFSTNTMHNLPACLHCRVYACLITNFKKQQPLPSPPPPPKNQIIIIRDLPVKENKQHNKPGVGRPNEKVHGKTTSNFPHKVIANYAEVPQTTNKRGTKDHQ